MACVSTPLAKPLQLAPRAAAEDTMPQGAHLPQHTDTYIYRDNTLHKGDLYEITNISKILQPGYAIMQSSLDDIWLKPLDISTAIRRVDALRKTSHNNLVIIESVSRHKKKALCSNSFSAHQGAFQTITVTRAAHQEKVNTMRCSQQQ